MKRFLPVLIALTLVSPAVASSNPGTIALRPSDVPSGFHPTLHEAGSGALWARRNSGSVSDARRFHLMSVLTVAYTRPTRRGLWSIWNFVLTFRAARDMPDGFQFITGHEAEIFGGFQGYQEWTNPAGNAYVNSFGCRCSGRDEYRFYLWKYRGRYVIGTELRYATPPPKINAMWHLLFHYENIAVNRAR